MHPRRFAQPAAALALGALLALPAAAGGVPVSAGPGGAPDAVAQGVGGPTLTTRPGALVLQRHRFRGAAARSRGGHGVSLQQRGPNGTWLSVASAAVARDGTFGLRWTPRRVGRFALRAMIAGRGQAPAAASAPVRVTVFRPSVATWYGPGFYGATTACGRRLAPGMLGVAHRSLPCGTKVALLYRGRTLVVPVIDRGPYVAGVSWDLTLATARRLGADGRFQIGALALRR
jgi:rare lipoprotein A